MVSLIVSTPTPLTRDIATVALVYNDQVGGELEFVPASLLNPTSSMVDLIWSDELPFFSEDL